jgi:hypothetical protein
LLGPNRLGSLLGGYLAVLRGYIRPETAFEDSEPVL